MPGIGGGGGGGGGAGMVSFSAGGVVCCCLTQVTVYSLSARDVLLSRMWAEIHKVTVCRDVQRAAVRDMGSVSRCLCLDEASWRMMYCASTGLSLPELRPPSGEREDRTQNHRSDKVKSFENRIFIAC